MMHSLFSIVVNGEECVNGIFFPYIESTMLSNHVVLQYF